MGPFQKGTDAIRSPPAPTHDVSSSQKPHFLTPSPLLVTVSTYEFGRTQLFKFQHPHSLAHGPFPQQSQQPHSCKLCFCCAFPSLILDLLPFTFTVRTPVRTQDNPPVSRSGDKQSQFHLQPYCLCQVTERVDRPCSCIQDCVQACWPTYNTS